MSIEQERARIYLNKQDTINIENCRILTPGKVYNTVEGVRGGHGNKVLSIGERLRERLIEESRERNDIIMSLDYSKPTTFPTEWSNIQWGKDTVKLNKQDKWKLTGVLGSLITILSTILGLVLS